MEVYEWIEGERTLPNVDVHLLNPNTLPHVKLGTSGLVRGTHNKLKYNLSSNRPFPTSLHPRPILHHLDFLPLPRRRLRAHWNGHSTFRRLKHPSQPLPTLFPSIIRPFFSPPPLRNPFLPSLPRFLCRLLGQTASAERFEEMDE